MTALLAARFEQTGLDGGKTDRQIAASVRRAVWRPDRVGGAPGAAHSRRHSRRAAFRRRSAGRSCRIAWRALRGSGDRRHHRRSGRPGGDSVEPDEAASRRSRFQKRLLDGHYVGGVDGRRSPRRARQAMRHDRPADLRRKLLLECLRDVPLWSAPTRRDATPLGDRTRGFADPSWPPSQSGLLETRRKERRHLTHADRRWPPAWLPSGRAAEGTGVSKRESLSRTGTFG